jgi:hypothetical protein
MYLNKEHQLDKRVHKIRVLLSSPGNLADDRQVARKVVENINLDSGSREGFVAELVTWETHTRPSVGDYSQDVINEQFPNDIDIFVGMMGSYFGTPTFNWGSGTEEEFRVAFKKHQDGCSPEIMFYFSNAVSSLSEVDHEQFLKTRKFRDEIGNLGVYYWNYESHMELQITLHRHLTASIVKIVKARSAAGDIGEPPRQSAALLPHYERLLIDNPRVDIELLVEQAISYLDDHTQSMTQLTTESVKLSKAVEMFTRSITQATKSGNTKGLERAFLKLFEAVRRYRKRLKENIPDIRSNFEKSMLLLQRAMLRRKTSNLIEAIPADGVFDSIRGMQKSALSLGGIINEMNGVYKENLGQIPALEVHVSVIEALHSDIEALHSDIEDFTQSVDVLSEAFCADFE